MYTETANSEGGEQSIRPILESSTPPRIQVKPGFFHSCCVTGSPTLKRKAGRQPVLSPVSRCVRVSQGQREKKPVWACVSSVCLRNACSVWVLSRPIHETSVRNEIAPSACSPQALSQKTLKSSVHILCGRCQSTSSSREE